VPLHLPPALLDAEGTPSSPPSTPRRPHRQRASLEDFVGPLVVPVLNSADGPCPAPLASAMDALLRQANALRADERWQRARVERSKGGVHIRTLPVSGMGLGGGGGEGLGGGGGEGLDAKGLEGILWWRAEFSIAGVTAEEVDTAFAPEHRAWDGAIAGIGHLCRWAPVADAKCQTRYAAVCQVTSPSLGGMILGRAFANLSVQRWTTAPDGLRTMDSAVGCVPY